jgi:hypothetical protein
MRWRASAADGSWRPGWPAELPHHDEDRGGPHRRRQRQVVREGVASAGVLLDVTVHAESLQGPVEPADGPSIGSVPCTVAADDGTRACQDALGIGVLRHAHAVIHAGGGELLVEGEQQREPAADAKANDPGLTRAALLAGQPGPHGVDVLEGPPRRAGGGKGCDVTGQCDGPFRGRRGSGRGRTRTRCQSRNRAASRART